MSVYDKNGNLTNVQASDAARDIREITAKLYAKLFADGMTVLEGQALVSYLASAVDFSTYIAITKYQMGQRIRKGQIDSTNGDD